MALVDPGLDKPLDPRLAALVGSVNVGFLALDIERIEAVDAEKRKLAALKQNAPVVEKIPQRQDSGKARDKAAKAVGANSHYVSDAKRLAEKAPDVAEAANVLPCHLSALGPYTRDIKNESIIKRQIGILFLCSRTQWPSGSKWFRQPAIRR